MPDKRRILLTGASGLLGSRFLDEEHGNFELHAVVRRRRLPEVPDVHYHLVDFSGAWSSDDLPKSVEAVVHLAQSLHFRDFPGQALDVFRVNVESTARLLDFAVRAGARKFIYASSGGVYGSSVEPFDENAPIVYPGQLGYYLGSKLCAEILVHNYAPLIDVIVLRFFFMYGARQRRSMLIPRIADNVRARRPIFLQGKDGIRINPVHVSDAAAMLRASLSCIGSQTINVAGTEILSLREIAEIIGEHAGIEPSFKQESMEPKNLVGNNSLMASMLGKPLVPFKKGVLDVF